MGIRYELTTVLTAVTGKVVGLRIPTNLQITLGNPLYRPIHDFIDPRIDFAWHPFSNNVIHAAYQIFPDQIMVSVFGNAGRSSARSPHRGRLSCP